jgi:hypothetical protein
VAGYNGFTVGGSSLRAPVAMYMVVPTQLVVEKVRDNIYKFLNEKVYKNFE